MTDKWVVKQARRLALHEKFSAKLTERIDELGQGWLAVHNKPSSFTLEHPFYRQVHSLAGAAGSFGYTSLGVCARELEQILLEFTEGLYPDEDFAEQVNATLEELRKLAASGADTDYSSNLLTGHTSSEELDDQPLLYILEDDAELAEELCNQLVLFGYQACAFDSDEAILAAHKHQSAAALIIDIGLQDGALHGTEIAPQLQSSGAVKAPLIFISRRDDWQARLAALRAGADAYFTKPLDFTQLVEVLERLLKRYHHDPYRVLIVDDDPLLAGHYASVLREARMDTIELNDPAGLLDVLPEEKPDIILMDLYMPSCTGIEAAQIIRQQPLYQGLPIIFLSTETGVKQQLNALRLGGDEFLQKPISDAHLVEAVSIRADRFRTLKNLMDRDGMTGLLNHINFKLALEREISLSRRRHAQLTVAMIDIDHFKKINDRFGHPTGDRIIKVTAWLLKQSLRETDIIARYGGEEFAVILPDTTIMDALGLVETIRGKLAETVFTRGDASFHVTLSGGIAGLTDRNDVDALIAAADDALYEAKQTGRDRVVTI